ncbi:DNA repair protein RadC [Paenibacillus lactis]
MNMYMIRSALADSLCIKENSSVMEELFSRYATPAELLNADPGELTSIKGIGAKKAQQIVSTLKLARAINTPRVENYKILCPKDAFQLMKFEIGHLLHEEFWILMLNTKNGVIAKHRVSVGTLNSAIVHPREVFRAAITRASASIICLHNHPSGDCTPSPEDISLSRRLRECGDLIGIEVLDSLVVHTDSYYSMKEQGLL